MAKQTGLLEVIFKMTVKNVMGESFGRLPVAVHMSLFLLMKTILIVRLTSLWTSRICTQKRHGLKLFGAAEPSRFCTQLRTRDFPGEGRWLGWLGPFAQIVLPPRLGHLLSTPGTACSVSPIYHRAPKSDGAALNSNALTRCADGILVWWDVINRCVGLRNLLLRYSAGSQFIPPDWKSLPLCFV